MSSTIPLLSTQPTPTVPQLSWLLKNQLLFVTFLVQLFLMRINYLILKTGLVSFSSFQTYQFAQKEHFVFVFDSLISQLGNDTTTTPSSACFSDHWLACIEIQWLWVLKYWQRLFQTPSMYIPPNISLEWQVNLIDLNVNIIHAYSSLGSTPLSLCFSRQGIKISVRKGPRMKRSSDDVFGETPNDDDDDVDDRVSEEYQRHQHSRRSVTSISALVSPNRDDQSDDQSKTSHLQPPHG